MQGLRAALREGLSLTLHNGGIPGDTYPGLTGRWESTYSTSSPSMGNVMCCHRVRWVVMKLHQRKQWPLHLSSYHTRWREEPSQKQACANHRPTMT